MEVRIGSLLFITVEHLTVEQFFKSQLPFQTLHRRCYRRIFKNAFKRDCIEIFAYTCTSMQFTDIDCIMTETKYWGWSSQIVIRSDLNEPIIWDVVSTTEEFTSSYSNTAWWQKRTFLKFPELTYNTFSELRVLKQDVGSMVNIARISRFLEHDSLVLSTKRISIIWLWFGIPNTKTMFSTDSRIRNACSFSVVFLVQAMMLFPCMNDQSYIHVA